MKYEEDICWNFNCFLRGDERAFAYYFRLWYKALCLFADRYTSQLYISQEIVSDVYLRVWERHGTFYNEKSLKSYLYLSVRNACFDHLKKEKRRSKVQLEQQQTSTILENIIRVETLNEIYRSGEDLPRQCKDIFNRFYLEGKTVREIAGELDLSVSTIKTQKARALKFIKRKLR